MARYDVVIIGAGHNGLVSAGFLAKAGLSVCVLERGDVPGGCIVDKEIIPGFKGPAGAHTVQLFAPHIMRELDLARHGLDIIPLPGRVSLFKEGGYVASSSNVRTTQTSFAALHPHDGEAYKQFHLALEQQRTLFKPFLEQAPGSPLPGKHHSSSFLEQLTAQLSHFGEGAAARAWAFWTQSCASFLDQFFEDERLKAHIAGPAFIGASKGPHEAGTAYGLLHRRLMPDLHGTKGFVKGGTGALGRALEKAVQAHGGEVRYECEVTGVNLNRTRATGVTLSNGETVEAHMVLSNLDLKRTFLTLFDWQSFPDDFVKRVGNYRMSGSTAKLNVALDGLPSFPELPQGLAEAVGLYGFASHMDELDKACDQWGDGFVPDRPYLEVAFPSLHDPVYAPVDQHVMSVYVQYVPNRLFDGVWDEARRENLVDRVLDQIAEHASGLKDKVLGWTLTTPSDFEEAFALTAGDIYHGDMALDQLLFNRPLPGFDEGLPFLENLYLCGAGGHPGGGITGLPGYIAASRLLHDKAKGG